MGKFKIELMVIKNVIIAVISMLMTKYVINEWTWLNTSIVPYYELITIFTLTIVFIYFDVKKMIKNKK